MPPGTPDGDTHGEPMPSSESGDSELSLDRTPVRLRSKRYVQRPGNLRVRTAGATVQGTLEQRTPSPGQRNLAPEWPGDELATTPKTESHSGGICEEGLEEGLGTAVPRPPCTRKLSREARLRKVSSAGIRDARRRDSGAEEGDDEGYGDLLSAYESEEGSRE